jgi:hypothetical protein
MGSVEPLDERISWACAEGEHAIKADRPNAIQVKAKARVVGELIALSISVTSRVPGF